MGSFSFASAQAALPPAILAELQDDVRCWRGGAHSLLELPFSGSAFDEIHAAAEQNLRDLLGLRAEHHVLFLQGGATAQFALTAMNLLRRGECAAYVETGLWSRRAAEAAAAWGDIKVAAKGDGCSLPPPENWRLPTQAVYCHFASTETAEGLQYHSFPDFGDTPLVADMTADFLSRTIPLAPFGLIYASAQKNIGVAGLTVVVIHEKMLDRTRGAAPSPFNYALQVAARSKVNTPPTFAIAVAGKMLRWLREGGGLASAEVRSIRKCASFYGVIDEDDFYCCPARICDRSRVSVRFHLVESKLDEEFAIEAEAHGLLHLRGHPSVGGLRASLYNAVPQEAADALADFMRDFRRRKG